MACLDEPSVRDAAGQLNPLPPSIFYLFQCLNRCTTLARPAVDLDRWLQPTDVRPAFGDRKALMPLWGAQPMPPPAWPQA